jgi:hypothetical protein
LAKKYQKGTKYTVLDGGFSCQKNEKEMAEKWKGLKEGNESRRNQMEKKRKILIELPFIKPGFTLGLRIVVGCYLIVTEAVVF